MLIRCGGVTIIIFRLPTVFYTVFNFDLEQWQSYIQHHNSSNNDKRKKSERQKSKKKKKKSWSIITCRLDSVQQYYTVKHLVSSGIRWFSCCSLCLSLFHHSLHHLVFIGKWNRKHSELLCRKRTSTQTMPLSRSRFVCKEMLAFRASIKCRDENRIGCTDSRRNSSFCFFFILFI